MSTFRKAPFFAQTTGLAIPAWENKTKLIIVFLFYLFKNKLDFSYQGQPEARVDAYLFLNMFGSILRDGLCTRIFLKGSWFDLWQFS